MLVRSKAVAVLFVFSFTIKVVLLYDTLELEIRPFQSDTGNRIVGGSKANIEDFPYQVSISYRGRHLCGGSIISPNHILTAAHCVVGRRAKSFAILAGTTSIKSSEKDKNSFTSPVTRIFRHGRFSSRTFNNDIAIMELAKPLPIGNTIQLVKLPEERSKIDTSAVGVASGWGSMYYRGPRVNNLREVELPILNSRRCARLLDFVVTSNMFCAGYLRGGSDTCQGDSGGPLVVDGVQIGITSWGDGCARRFTPGVYTKVSNYISFIEKVLDSEKEEEKEVHEEKGGKTAAELADFVDVDVDTDSSFEFSGF